LRPIIVSSAGRAEPVRAGTLRRGATPWILEPEQFRELVQLARGEFLRIHSTEPDHIASIQRDRPYVANV
jgi:hypothetical protein